MAERQILFDAISIRRVHQQGGAEAAAAFGFFGLQQVPFTGAHAQYFAGGGDLETLGHRFPGLDAFLSSHKNPSALKRTRTIGSGLATGKAICFWRAPFVLLDQSGPTEQSPVAIDPRPI